MKLFLLGWLAFLPLLSIGQTAQPFKGANVVVITTTDSAKVALKRLARQLQAQGFVIDRLDYDLASLSTKAKGLRSIGGYTVAASATYEPGHLVLRGQWHGQFGHYSTDEPAAYTTASSRAALAELQAAAVAYPGGAVSYEKRP
jgi:hypothetical protein